MSILTFFYVCFLQNKSHTIIYIQGVVISKEFNHLAKNLIIWPCLATKSYTMSSVRATKSSFRACSIIWVPQFRRNIELIYWYSRPSIYRATRGESKFTVNRIVTYFSLLLLRKSISGNKIDPVNRKDGKSKHSKSRAYCICCKNKTWYSRIDYFKP